MKHFPPYNLDQLAAASGESERTIRSWIKEGLLPPAVGKGRGAYYAQEHMDRLLFIRRLREATGTRLPLAVMRDVLDRLYASDDPDVVRRVAHGEEKLEVASLFDPLGSVVDPVSPGGAAARSVGKHPNRDAQPSHGRPARPRKTWSRSEPTTTIQIQPDLELRLRSDDPERVAWLARLARKLRTWIHEGEP